MGVLPLCRIGLLSLIVVADCGGGGTFSSPPGEAITPACFPPVPAITQAYPHDHQSGVPVDVGRVWFSSPPATDASLVTVFQVRLIAPNTTAVDGGKLAPSQPPPDVPPGPPTAVQWFAGTVPRLASGTTYQVELFEPTLLCLTPLTTGSFST